MADQAVPTHYKRPIILVVDDEPFILQSIKRLFHLSNYEVLVAPSGELGLSLVKENRVDLIISDMRMPDINGVQFLAKVKEIKPEIVCILLTGFTDFNSAIDAVNKGHIYSYLSKPWDNEQLKATVKNAMQRRMLEKEKQSLVKIMQLQNQELQALNNNLESEVKKRTDEIHQTMLFLDQAYRDIETNYKSAIKVFANLLELREGQKIPMGKKIADDAVSLAEKFNLSEDDKENIYYAALLSDIGTVTLRTSLTERSYESLTIQEKLLFEKHPRVAYAALIQLPQMQTVAQLILTHREHVNGKGYPSGISINFIPLGAQIISVVKDYFLLVNGKLLLSKLDNEEAKDYLLNNVSKRYDEKIVTEYVKFLEDSLSIATLDSYRKIKVSQLQPGMILAKDLQSSSGLLLLSKGQVLTLEVINNILEFEHNISENFTIYIDV